MFMMVNLLVNADEVSDEEVRSTKSHSSTLAPEPTPVMTKSVDDGRIDMMHGSGVTRDDGDGNDEYLTRWLWWHHLLWHVPSSSENTF